MRFDEFAPTPEQLNEIKMAAGSLIKQVKNINAIAGIEFEFYCPNEGGSPSTEEDDMDMDETAYNFDSIRDFFRSDQMTEREVNAEISKMEEEYYEYIQDDIEKAWDQYIDDNLTEEWVLDWADAEYNSDEDVLDDIRENGSGSIYWDEAKQTYTDEQYDTFRDDWYDENYIDMQEQFLRWSGIERMSDVPQYYDLYWPYQKTQTDLLSAIQYVADKIEYDLDISIDVGTGHHSVDRTGENFILETDGSLDDTDEEILGLEFITPPLPLEETLQLTEKFMDWANDYECYTNSDCGLHMNISVEGVDNSKLDYVKLALFVGENYVLEQFSRTSSGYATSVLHKLDNIISSANDDMVMALLDDLKNRLVQNASKAIHKGATAKYDGLNVHREYVEFRYAGNDYLNMDFNSIANFLRRYAVAYNIACNPEAEREEYIKKLYKLIDTSGLNRVKHQAVIEYMAGRSISPELLRPATIAKGINQRASKTGDERNKKWEITIDPKTYDIDKQRGERIKKDTEKFEPFITTARTKEEAIRNFKYEKYNTYLGIPSFYLKVKQI